MTPEWTSIPPELLVRLDRSRPLGLQLQAELREAVRTDRLSAGERLPSTRGLAAQLGLARGTVVQVYEQLVAEGYFSSSPGSATRVAARAQSRDVADVSPVTSAQPRWDLRPGIPDLASFPRADWTRSLAEVLRSATNADLGYGQARGTVGLRSSLAAYLRRVRGAATTDDGLVIVAGFAQGITLACTALRAEGHALLAVEDPGDRSIDVVARMAGLEAIPVRVDEEGLDVSALEASGARAVVVTPAHQSPTGVVLSPTRRRALLEWAERVDGIVIEDDYDSEFRYDRQPVGALHGLAPEHVVLIGSTSKTLAPALRLGWLAAPVRMLDPIIAAKELADRGTPAIDQLALARLIESGRFDRHLRRMRSVYRARREVLMAALPTVSGLAAGFHAVLALPVGTDEDAVVAAALERSVRIVGLGSGRVRPELTRPAIVIGFGNTDSEGLKEALAELLGVEGVSFRH